MNYIELIIGAVKASPLKIFVVLAKEFFFNTLLNFDLKILSQISLDRSVKQLFFLITDLFKL